MRLSRTLSAIALTSIGIWGAASCGGSSDTTTTEQPTKGTISGRVIDTDSANGGVAGISVQLSLAGGAAQSATTNATGQFSLGSLDPGAWTVTVSPPNGRLLATGETGTRSATVVAGNTPATVADFQLARTKGSISGSVKNGTTGVAGASLSLARPGFSSRGITTDASGNFALASVPTGTWILSISVPSTLQLGAGEPGIRTVTIVADQSTATLPFAMDPRTQQSTSTVHLIGSSFSPANLTITAGTTVTWINDEAAAHTITPQDASQPGVFGRVSFASSGTVLQHTFSTPGQVYHYRCELHSDGFTTGMVGTITVQ